jgi:hypothetical protein
MRRSAHATKALRAGVPVSASCALIRGRLGDNGLYDATCFDGFGAPEWGQMLADRRWVRLDRRLIRQGRGLPLQLAQQFAHRFFALLGWTGEVNLSPTP